MPDPSAPSITTASLVAAEAGPAAPVGATVPGRRRSGRWAPVRVLLVVIVVAAVAVAWLLTRPSGPAYRTAAVATGDAVATLSEVGTITPVQQSDLTFTVGGKVGTVDVTVGQQVAAGQTVATLDTTSLQSAVVTAEANLASAQATLASDETTQAEGSTTTVATSTGSGGSGTAASRSTTATTSPSSGGSGGTGASAEVTKLQATLVADQHQQDADATAAGAALQTATTTCTAGSTPGVTEGQAPTPSVPPGGSGGSGGSGGTGGTGGTGGSGGSGGGGQLTCTQALSAASAAHQALVTAIDKVTKDEAALAAALGLDSSGGSGGTGGAGGTGGTGGSGGGGAGSPAQGGTSTTTTSTTSPTSASDTKSTSTASSSSSGTGGHTRTVTPELIALDQANVDVAQAALAAAQRDVGQSNLISTIAGTVGSVDLTVGQTVGAGAPSSTPQVVVVGSGTDYEVATTVPVTAIKQVAVGQQALVTPDSSSTVLAGTVSGIGVLGTTSTTSTTYPVTIAFQSSDLGPFSGAESSVQIVTGQASGVTTVPSSAVRTVGARHLVTVIENGKTTSVPVTLGTVGAIRTQILSGVHVGETVSLATMGAPVPSSSTTTRGGLNGLAGTGGFAGAGGFGGGAGGGGFTRASLG